MTEVTLEILVILMLIVGNGVFAMSEIAVVSSKKTRLRQMAEKRERGAAAALALAEDPTRFLSTVQLGITLVGILAGAFGGATLSRKLANGLQEWLPWTASFALPISFAVVVGAVAYASLVIGELVPKRLALLNPERFASFFAPPMTRLASLAGPIVAILSRSTNFFLSLVGRRAATEQAVTEDEVRGMVREGARAGAIHAIERQMLEGVMELDRIPVRQIMTPRTRMIAFEIDDPHSEIWPRIVASDHSEFPVYDEYPDNIVGTVSVKSLYAHVAAGISINLRDLIVEPRFVMEAQNALQALDQFRARGNRLAIVTDEFGGVSGAVTLRDIVSTVVGDIQPTAGRNQPAWVARSDGSILADGLLSIEEVQERIEGLQFPEGELRQYQTLGGFICHELGHVAHEGESVRLGPFSFEVVDMDRRRIDKVLISRIFPDNDSKGGTNVQG